MFANVGNETWMKHYLSKEDQHYHANINFWLTIINIMLQHEILYLFYRVNSVNINNYWVSKQLDNCDSYHSNPIKTSCYKHVSITASMMCLDFRRKVQGMRKASHHYWPVALV